MAALFTVAMIRLLEHIHGMAFTRMEHCPTLIEKETLA
jgi:hypothetical protein